MTRHPMRIPDPAQAGFTLIELLVSVVLVGLIAILGNAGVRIAVAAWDQARVDPSEVLTAQHLMRAWIEEAMPVPAERADTESRADGAGTAGRVDGIDFTGRADGMSWIVDLPERFGPGGPHRVTLSADGPDRGRDLVLAWSLFRPAPLSAFPGAARNRPLVRRIDQVRFRYFGPRERDGKPEWSDSWEQRRELPRLIEIALRFPDADARLWPTLTVAPHLDRATPVAEIPPALPRPGRRPGRR
jgi:prepilin-type N-terminal cleavage/methylation domain-containing protein